MFELCEVTVTAADPDWLAALGANLVAARLAATAQLTPIRMIYRSQGRRCQHVGSRLTMHTRRSQGPAMVDRVRTGTPVSCPEWLRSPSPDGDPTYLQWVRHQTNARTPVAAAAGDQ